MCAHAHARTPLQVVRVTLPDASGRESAYEAQVVGTDSLHDLAVLQVRVVVRGGALQYAEVQCSNNARVRTAYAWTALARPDH